MVRFDLTGKKFGRLTVTSLHSKGKRTLWNAVCDCGVIKVCEAYCLKTGHTKSCGCYHSEVIRSKGVIIPVGTKFNNLTMVKELERVMLPSGQENRVYLCLCDCGKDTIVRHSHLIKNKIKTCGCLVGESHGMSQTKLYRVWRQMQERCHKDYTIERNKKNYQNRGISVCAEWRNSFLSFYNWSMANGYKEGLEIDRRNNDGNYEPSNCRYITRIENMANRNMTIFIVIYGEKKPIAEWSRISGICYSTLWVRFKSGWTDDRILKPTWKALQAKKTA